MTSYTSGAMRAAERLEQVVLATPDQVATIITEETGDAELLAALEDLVERCDGAEGVRADGSNIQTMRAHTAIARARGEQP